MIPVDMRGVGTEFADIEDMVKELGFVGAAEAFVKARDYFVANKDKVPEEERKGPMTAADWKSALAEYGDSLEGEESDIISEEGEEEEGEEEDEEDDEEGAEEPAAKEAKTSA